MAELPQLKPVRGRRKGVGRVVVLLEGRRRLGSLGDQLDSVPAHFPLARCESVPADVGLAPFPQTALRRTRLRRAGSPSPSAPVAPTTSFMSLPPTAAAVELPVERTAADPGRPRRGHQRAARPARPVRPGQERRTERARPGREPAPGPRPRQFDRAREARLLTRLRPPVRTGSWSGTRTAPRFLVRGAGVRRFRSVPRRARALPPPRAPPSQPRFVPPCPRGRGPCQPFCARRRLMTERFRVAGRPRTTGEGGEDSAVLPAGSERVRRELRRRRPEFPGSYDCRRRAFPGPAERGRRPWHGLPRHRVPGAPRIVRQGQEKLPSNVTGAGRARSA